MSTPRLNSLFEYLATLIAERGPNQPLLVSQLQNAITYKFPDFTFEGVQLNGLKDFVLAGEKAGYFKFVNTGSFQTAYLLPGTKQPGGASGEMGANDPRRQRWMTLAMENLVTADRADQIIEAMQGSDVLSREFDAYLAAQIRTATLYPTRGKLKRLRDFFAEYRAKGEAQAVADWQVSRVMLRMPPTPPLDGAGRAQSQIWALLQGSTTIAEIPAEQLDNLFFAVLNYCREQVLRNKSWDWGVALDILEAEARAVPRPAPPPQKKAGLFGGKAQPVISYELDEKQITALTEQLRLLANGQGSSDDTATWEALVQNPTMETSYRFLLEHPKLAEDERLVTWLEEQIGQNVADGAEDAVKNLANKAALVIGVRQFGLEGVRQQSGELRGIFESVMEGAKLLGLIFGFIDAADPPAAAWYFSQNNTMSDESIGPLFEDQLRRAAQGGDVARFRRVSERVDLWHSLLDFGMEQGVSEHERYLAAHRDDKLVQTEMGFMLLLEAATLEERQDIISRYPSVAGKHGLELANQSLDMLSFHSASSDVYNKHYDVKRLIERCQELGVDRALGELRE